MHLKITRYFFPTRKPLPGKNGSHCIPTVKSLTLVLLPGEWAVRRYQQKYLLVPVLSRSGCLVVTESFAGMCLLLAFMASFLFILSLGKDFHIPPWCAWGRSNSSSPLPPSSLWNVVSDTFTSTGETEPGQSLVSTCLAVKMGFKIPCQLISLKRLVRFC